jgi:hypothetical protein
MRAPADKDPARSPLASGDSGVVELLDGTRITYRPIGPENAAALQRFHHRLSDRSVRLRFFRRQAGAHRQEGGVLHPRGRREPLRARRA